MDAHVAGEVTLASKRAVADIVLADERTSVGVVARANLVVVVDKLYVAIVQDGGRLVDIVTEWMVGRR